MRGPRYCERCGKYAGDLTDDEWLAVGHICSGCAEQLGELSGDDVDDIEAAEEARR